MKAENFEYKLPEDYTIKPETRLKLDSLIDEVNHKGQIDNQLAQRFMDLHVEMVEEYATLIEESETENGKTE